MPKGFEVTGEGIVYRNPDVHIKSIHAYFPSVVELGNGEMLCAMLRGEAFESENGRVCLARSYDYGATWADEGRMLPEPEGKFSEAARISLDSDGSIIGLVFRYDRHRDNAGLADPDTLGFTETTIYTCKSTDGGRTWSELSEVKPPLAGPPFELCCPIQVLDNGDWILPTSTWRCWDGSNPAGVKAVAFISHDKGKSWPDCVDVMNGVSEGVMYWEGKIVEMAPGQLLSVMWVYDERNAADRPNAYNVSADSGCTFSAPASTGLAGQTPAILPLGTEKVLCIYRRTDTVGLWAAIASVDGGEWDTLEQIPLWGASGITVGEKSANMVKIFNVLRFGAPNITRLSNGDIFTVFWCVEDCVSNIRWIRARISD